TREVRAEPIEAQWATGGWRLQKPDCRKQSQDGSVILSRFAGEPVEQIPLGDDTIQTAPLEKLDVAQCGHAFSHQREHVVAQTLDPGLYPCDAGLTKDLDLAARQIGLDLVEELHGSAPPSESREHLLEILHVDDVVDRLDQIDLPSVDELIELSHGPPC